MTTRGRIEVRINPGSTATTDFFVTLHNFMLGLPGVTRIACNYGSGGTGIDYRDAPTTIGTNAWAVFKFGNAITPFYVLIQCVNTTGSGTNIATPGNVSMSPATNTQFFGVAIAIAQRLDGGSPWAGSTSNNGSDTKGTPVWTPGVSSASYWPRVNASGGAYATNREGLMILNNVNVSSNEEFVDIYAQGARVQFLGDEENLLILTDRSADGSYCQFYFGRYVPRPGLSVQCPYVCLHQSYAPGDPIIRQMNNGSTTVNQSNNYTALGDGGVAHPVVSTGVKIVYTDYPSNTFNSTYQPNRAQVPARYDLFPIQVGINEHPYYGLMGTISFFRLGYNIPPHYLSPDRKLAAFGNSSVQSGKLVVAWDGATAIGSGNTRQGVSF